METENAQASQPEQTTPAVASENNAAPVETQVEKATEAEATGDDAPATEDKPKPKKADGGFQRRISELTREFREAQRREAEATQRADKLLDELRSRSGATAVPKASGDDQAPRQEDFASYEAYIDARADFRARQTVKAERERTEREAHETRARQTESQRRETLQKAAAQAAEKFPDFEEVLADVDIPVTPAMIEVLIESDMKSDLMYWLAKNPDEARSLAAKSPASQARMLGQIEERLRSATPRKTVTEASDPPRTVKGRGPASPDPEKMSMEEYTKWRRSQS